MPDPNVDIQSGMGGYILVGGNRFDIGRWELQIDPRLIERTNTTARKLVTGQLATMIGTRYRPTVYDISWKIEFPWDNANPPGAVGLIAGFAMDLVLHRGTPDPVAGNRPGGYKIYDTCMGPTELFDDSAKDVVRATMSGKGGDITDLWDVPIGGSIIIDDTSGDDPEEGDPEVDPNPDDVPIPPTYFD